MSNNRTGRRIVRQPTNEDREWYQAALEEERAGIEANKTLGRELLAERRELSAIVLELKAIRERLNLSIAELAQRTGISISELSRLENMDGPTPTIETLRRYARALGHRIEIAVIAEQ